MVFKIPYFIYEACLRFGNWFWQGFYGWLFTFILVLEDNIVLGTGGMGSFLRMGRSSQYWARGYEIRIHYYIDGEDYDSLAQSYPWDILAYNPYIMDPYLLEAVRLSPLL